MSSLIHCTCTCIAGLNLLNLLNILKLYVGVFDTLYYKYYKIINLKDLPPDGIQ